MKKLLFVFGTRPEAIKLAPLINSIKENNKFEVKVCVTSQHKEMLSQVLDVFDITPDYDLNVMSNNQSLNSLTSKIIKRLEEIIIDYEPQGVIVHGDTTTTFSAAWAAFNTQKKIIHIEAGLRTHDIKSPWPEEANRKLTSIITDLHFSPTKGAKENLEKEGVKEHKIFVTGNTVIDALLATKETIEKKENLQLSLKKKMPFIQEEKKIILVTGHRRENFGKGLRNICNALSKISTEIPKVQIIFSVHLNPNVQETVMQELSEHKNIILCEPFDYLAFVYLMMKAKLILTDSGGIQEEAPSLGVPVLVMRSKTERPEGINAGTIGLVGTNEKKIYDEVLSLLTNDKKYKEMSNAKNPYGDGKACQKIVKVLENEFI